MKRKRDKQMYRVILVFPLGETRSVFVQARNRAQAERRALRRYPKATQVDRSSFPQS